MIGEFLLNIVFTLAGGVLSVVPDISWNPDTSAFVFLRDILSVVGYLLPMETVILIVDLIIALTLFMAAVSLIRTLWALLPFA